MPRLTSALLAALVFAPHARAGIVVWDPPDSETGSVTLFRLDTGETGLLSNTPLADGADFQVSPLMVAGPLGIPLIEGVQLSVASQPAASGPGAFTGTGLAINGDGALRRLSPGELIGDDLDFLPNALAYSRVSAFISFDWAPGDSGFVGLELSIDGQDHYGWAELTLGSEVGRYTLSRFAYETTPSTPIAAAAVPESTSFSLLGLGGLLAACRVSRRVPRCA